MMEKTKKIIMKNKNKEKKDNTKEVNSENWVYSDDNECYNCWEFWKIGHEYGTGMCTQPFSINYKKKVSYNDTCPLFEPNCG